jgi:hypothetical protein
MIRICCFCDKVHDDAVGLWQERRCFASAGAHGEAAILWYTCCRQCFQVDPRASVFRARQSEPSASCTGAIHASALP